MAPPSDPDMCHHERFYFSDGSLYLIVENSLYRVHRSLFEIHASKFPACGLDTSGGEACSLKDVKKVDFDRFLACLYPRALLVEEAKSTEEWISILKLASKWGFESLQSRAISKIEHTLVSPVDKVVFGRQYNIPDLLWSGYATLCQGTSPLSFEEGRRLGVEDVVNIYRIRHELYGSVITPVPFEEALKKVRISLSNEEQEDEKGLEAERSESDLGDEQSSEQTDAGSVAASPTTLVEETVSLPADSHAGTDGSDGSLDADPASQTSSVESDKEMVDSASNTLVDVERPEGQPGLVSEQEQSDPNTVSLPSETPLDAPTGTEKPSAQEDSESEEERFDERSPGGLPTVDASSSRSSSIPTVISGDVHVPESSGPGGQVFRFLDELTTTNFDPVANNIIQWFKGLQPMPNSQAIYQITQSIVERATTKQPGQLCILARLCQGMVTRLTNVQVRDPKGKVASGGLLFRDYLGDTCHENLKTVAALAVAAGERTDDVRRLFLIKFISKLAKPTDVKIWTLATIDKWMATLLDANDEEKVVTLCMLMTHAGPLWDKSPKKKLRTRVNGWFQEMSNIAKRTSKPRIGTLLKDVIKRRNLGWVAK